MNARLADHIVAAAMQVRSERAMAACAARPEGAPMPDMNGELLLKVDFGIGKQLGDEDEQRAIDHDINMLIGMSEAKLMFAKARLAQANQTASGSLRRALLTPLAKHGSRYESTPRAACAVKPS